MRYFVKAIEVVIQTTTYMVEANTAAEATAAVNLGYATDIESVRNPSTVLSLADPNHEPIQAD